MIVVDASALVEALLEGPDGAIAGRLLGTGEALQAPHLIDVEVAQVIRRILADGRMDLRRAEQAIQDLAEFPLARHPRTLLLPRIWELRNNLTAYDAVYVALAEALDALLITRDARLARAPGHRARVELA